MEKVNLNKVVYSKNQYEKVIDTKFSQLANTLSNEEIRQIITSPSITVEQFFSYYDELFFTIPKEGEINSHEYLVKRSSEYINANPTDDTIQALIDEINLLQQTNLELNQQLIELSLTGSQQI